MKAFEDFAGYDYNREFDESYLLQRYPNFVLFVEQGLNSLYKLKGVVKTSDYKDAKEVFKTCDIIETDEVLTEIGI